MRFAPRTLRGRITLIFALVTLALAALVGVLVDVQYRSALTSALDDALVTRFHAVAQQVQDRTKTAVTPALPDSESFAQVITSSGAVVAAAPRSLEARSVLTAADLARARDHRLTLVRDAGPRGETARLLAGPAGAGADVIVVGTTLDETQRAQHRLELALAVGLPLLALLVTVAGWFLAGAALSPVQSMIEDADVIAATSARQVRRRLSVRDRAPAELTELAQGLNQLLERIEAALEHERAFVDDASHELRTPIAIARGELELARAVAMEHPETVVALDSALEEIDRLDRLAGSLLVLARSRAAAPAPSRALSLHDVAQRGADLAVATRPLSSAVRVAPVTGDATVLADADALERAVRNLVENALRFAASEVTVTVAPGPGGPTVEVADDGPGFPAPLLAEGVGRFARKDGDGHGGAGLGLAIADAIASVHGGSVELANRPAPGGAVARLRLPDEIRVDGEPRAG